MGKTYESIGPDLRQWLEAQRVFFVSTAPLAGEGHINCSPKGGDCFRVLDGHTVAYQDYTGSGIETLAHVRENGRMLLMFCAFVGPPKIARLHGMATAHVLGNPKYRELAALFPANPGARAVFVLEVERVSDSCGFAVPFFDYAGPREALDRWAGSKGPEALEEYRALKNLRSIDGLPAWSAEE